MYDKVQIANAFNDFYINVGPSLADKIDWSNINVKYDDFLKAIDNNNSMFIAPTNKCEILKNLSLCLKHLKMLTV